MKRLLLSIIAVSIFGLNTVNAQCTVASQSISENFDAGVWPACWTGLGTAGISTDKIRIQSYYQSAAATFVLPKTVNAKGVITFIAQNTTNSQQGYGDVTVGAVSDPTNMGSFVPITTVNIYPTISGNQIVYAPYTVDLSSYTGNFQYIVFNMPGGSNYHKVINIDNMVYESACISQSVTALTQDLTVQLDATGNASITASQIDNGSSSDCDPPALSIDISSFSCDNVGPNTVVLTAEDGEGNVETASATVTILAAIDEETVTANMSSVCDGSAATISTASSVTGIEYYLRDDSDDSVIDGPITGTGNALAFNTGNLSSATTYNIYAQAASFVTQTGALEFDGVDDYVSSSAPAGFTYNTSYTVEGWVKTPNPGAAGGYQSIFFAGTNAASDIEVYVQQGTNALVVVHNRGNGGTLQGATFTIPPNNTWFHLAIVYNGSTVQTYFDGVSQGSFAIATPVVSANAEINLGYMQSSTFDPAWGSKNMLGSLDNFRLWSTVRTGGEIASEMSNCSVGIETGLEAYYNFEDGTGSTLLDLANGNDGTLTNMDNSDWVSTGSITCAGLPLASCDREMTQMVTVSIGATYNQSESAMVCAGSSYTFPDGSSQTISAQTVYSSNLTTVVAGCDSIIETTVDINPTFDLTESESVCFDGSFIFPDGTTQNNIQSQVVYTSNLFTAATQCDSIIETTVNVTTVDASTTQNGNTLTATESGVDYQWIDCDNGNAPISGAENQGFTPASSGNYAVEVTVNGCTETSACTNMIVTGINESTQLAVKVYPIPTRNVLFIESDEAVKTISIYSTGGSLIKTYAQNLNQIDVSTMAKGIYVLQVVSESSASQFRFVKE